MNPSLLISGGQLRQKIEWLRKQNPTHYSHHHNRKFQHKSANIDSWCKLLYSTKNKTMTTCHTIVLKM